MGPLTNDGFGKPYGTPASSIDSPAESAPWETIDRFRSHKHGMVELGDTIPVKGDELGTVDEDVDRVTILVQAIATDCESQRDQIREVGGAVEEVSNLTQRVAANAEESASASEELNAQATTMQELVQRFKVKASDGYPRALARRDPRKSAGRIGIERREYDPVAAKWAS